MAIVRENLDALNVRLTVQINKDDYKGDLKNKLSEYRKKAQLKGFRQGKTPMSVIRKMFGRQILADVVNDKMQAEMGEFLFSEENKDKLKFLGQPIPAEDQDTFEYSLSNLEDYNFKFDLGLAPEFDLKGVADKHKFTQYVVTPDADKLGEELMNLRRKMGETSEEEVVAEEDIITLKALELQDGAPKVGGLDKEFTLFIKNTTKETKATFIGKTKGEQVELNVFELEEETTEKHVRRYMLGLEEDDDREIAPIFSLTIEKISRFAAADLNEEFFEKAFGEGDVSSEKEALAKIKDDYKQHFTKHTDGLLFRDFQEYLMENNPMDFPESFLKRWLVASNEKNTPESVEQGFEGFTKGLQWTMLREKLIKHFDLDVSKEELRAQFGIQVESYFGGSRPEWMEDSIIDNMVNKMMEDEKGVNEMFDTLIMEKIQDALKEGYKLKEKAVSVEEFEAIVEEVKAKVEAESNLISDEEE